MNHNNHSNHNGNHINPNDESHVFNPYFHPDKSSDGECFKGGFIAVIIFLSVNVLLFLLALALGEEARIVFRGIATFPLSQIHNVASDIQLGESWGTSLVFLLANSVIYFVVGLGIGYIVKQIKHYSKAKK